ncbi:MAG: hypothetical protein LUH23_00945 [Oscillospiraceae bacterium]|nr:hypothetical protein [Oscillospiraceae bacterium]
MAKIRNHIILSVITVVFLIATTIMLATVCTFAAENQPLGEFLEEYDYSIDADFSYCQNFYIPDGNYDPSSTSYNFCGTYYSIESLSGVLEILLEDSDIILEDVLQRDEYGIGYDQCTYNCGIWNQKRIHIVSSDSNVPRLFVYETDEGDSYLIIWETGMGCQLSDGTYDRILDALTIATTSDGIDTVYNYFPDGIEASTPSDGELDTGYADTDENSENSEENSSVASDENPKTGVIIPFSIIVFAFGTAVTSKRK